MVTDIPRIWKVIDSTSNSDRFVSQFIGGENEVNLLSRSVRAIAIFMYPNS
jgi:hypothetical protein